MLPPNNYSGKTIMDNVDALATIHGTSAIEYAAFGKPVLVADKGWYNDFDFAISTSKEEYINLLEKGWFSSINIKSKSAKLFAGLYFGIPSWQKKAVLPDDADRKPLRSFLPDFVKKIIMKSKRN